MFDDLLMLGSEDAADVVGVSELAVVKLGTICVPSSRVPAGLPANALAASVAADFVTIKPAEGRGAPAGSGCEIPSVSWFFGVIHCVATLCVGCADG